MLSYVRENSIEGNSFRGARLLVLNLSTRSPGTGANRGGSSPIRARSAGASSSAKLLRFSLALLGCLGPLAFAIGGELNVIKSYAACKDTANVERFEEFERKDDDAGYKRLYFTTGASRECIFLRKGEILTGGEVQANWACVKVPESDTCYWTRPAALEARDKRF